MITFYTLCTILIGHWIFDFFLQTKWMAENKSSSNDALFRHIMVYTIGLALIAVANIEYLDLLLTWVVINAAVHYFIDYCTSRATKLLAEQKNWHDFFVVIGADQLLHYITLVGTFIWLDNF